MELEMFNTLLGPLLFAIVCGVWGFYARPEKRDQLLLALTLLLVFSGGVSYLYPSPDLFVLVVGYALVVTSLLALSFRQASHSGSRI